MANGDIDVAWLLEFLSKPTPAVKDWQLLEDYPIVAGGGDFALRPLGGGEWILYHLVGSSAFSQLSWTEVIIPGASEGGDLGADAVTLPEPAAASTYKAFILASSSRLYYNVAGTWIFQGYLAGTTLPDGSRPVTSMLPERASTVWVLPYRERPWQNSMVVSNANAQQTTSTDTFAWLGPWDEGLGYSQSDIVSFRGIIYIAIANNANVYPSIAINAAAARAAWRPLSPVNPPPANDGGGLQWRGEWALGGSYSQDDVVFFLGKCYVALRPHIASGSPEKSLAARRAVDLPILQYRTLWSGDHDMTMDGKIWRGVGSIIDITPSSDTIGPPNARFSLTLRATDPNLRAALLVDRGPLEVVVRWAYSLDERQTWTPITRVFRGRLSRPVLDAGTCTVELETDSGDIPVAESRYWSDNDQRSHYPGDRGFEFVKQLSEGVEILWPP